MPTFTARLCDLMDSGFDIGLTTDDYPIFDETHRETLNKRITDHYAFYEIGTETPEQFRFMLNRRMREIMPYFNKLYDSEKIVFDPLSTVDMNSSEDATNSSTNSTNAKSRVTNSDLPQVHLSPNEDYASSGADSISDTTNTGEGTGSVTHATTGRQGPAASLLMNYRASLLNIDMLVVAQVADLFMGIWQTHDDYSREEW